jgi:hypothetical protein
MHPRRASGCPEGVLAGIRGEPFLELLIKDHQVTR